jgi:hypothetical protein
MSEIIITPLLFSEFYTDVPTLEYLTSEVRAFDWHYFAERCVGIAAISWKSGVEDPVQQQALVQAFARDLIYAPALLDRLRREPERRLYLRESLLALLRVCLMERAASDTQVSDREFQGGFHRALLMANELVFNELNPPVVTNTASDLLPTELRSILSRIPDINDLVERTFSLFAWNATQRSTKHAEHLPLSDDFKNFTGQTPENYMASIYVMLSRCAAISTWDQFSQLGVAFKPTAWLQTLGISKMDEPLTWIERHTVELEAVCTDWKKTTSLSFAGAGPLWNKPLVHGDDDLHFIPSPFFLANMFGDGAYFELFDGYGNENEKFSTLFGHFFQDYVEDRFRAGYKGRDNVEIWCDIPYPGGQSTDVIVNEAGDILFIEVVAKRMQLLGSILHLDEESIAKDLLRGVLIKIKQLHANIAAFNKKTLLPDVSRPTGQRIFPILVSPNEWPRIHLLKNVLTQEPFASFLPDCEPLEFLDAGEVEDLEGRLQAGLSLSHLLDRKNRGPSPQHRVWSMHNYLTLAEPGTYGGITPPARERGREIIHSLAKLGVSWQ